MCPQLLPQERQVSASYINDCLGLDLSSDRIADLLSRMALDAHVVNSGEALQVQIPVTRSDVLHDADVMEVPPPPGPQLRTALNFRHVRVLLSGIAQCY